MQITALRTIVHNLELQNMPQLSSPRSTAGGSIVVIPSPDVPIFAAGKTSGVGILNNSQNQRFWNLMVYPDVPPAAEIGILNNSQNQRFWNYWDLTGNLYK